MRAGPLRHKCSLQHCTLVPEPGGGSDEVWTVLIESLWAEIGLPTGRLQPVADQVQAVVTAEIKVRYSRKFAAGMRLVHKSTGDTYLIEAALPGNQRDMLRLLCSNVINP
ncbi:phage head closure protein [Pseudomonas sp. WOUb67]|uniref:phage head closure protein n=1 Tax=Pseudomonas sp. WOUb67 TaxID=3161136 RepID=UPI003CEE6795